MCAAPTPGEKGIPDRRAELQRRLWRRLIWKAPLILALVSFAVWWEWRREDPALRRSAPSPRAAELAGVWSAELAYDRGESFTESFFFQPEGGRLFGTASFRGAKHGIQEGRIDGLNIAFFIRFEERSGSLVTDHKNYYWGVLDGEKIRMRLQDDRGDPPLDFVLSKSGASAD
jgi:hypothetical protein